MSSYIAADIRRLVQSRADGVCEYCLIHEADTYLGCQVDHIISEKHEGLSDDTNLALACTFCNRAKGTDIGSLSESTRQFVPFFNPRRDKWTDHFQIRDALIEPLTPVGEVTVKILGFNHVERQLEREELMRAGKYPSESAIKLVGLPSI